MKKGFLIFAVGICACLFSGCGVDSAMEELVRQQMGPGQAADEVADGSPLPEEDLAEAEPTAVATVEPTPVETPTPFYNNGGNASEQESTAEPYDWDTEYSDTEESEEEEYAAEADYIFPYSNMEKLTKADLEGMTAEELRLGRNEIYARHGRLFDDEELQSYFNGKDWYFGCIAPSEFVDSLELNDVERWNAKFIRKYE